MRKKKYKLSKAGKIYISIIVLIIGLLVLSLVKKLLINDDIKDSNNDNNNVSDIIDEIDNNDNNVVEEIDKSLDFIVSTKESDSDIIKEIFADGMNLSDFKKVYNQKENYVSENGKYKYIEYDFDKKLHYSEIEEILYSVNNSDIVKLEIIGKSHDSRNLYGVEIGKGSKVLYIDANIHAAEVAGTLYLTRFINDIVYRYENGDQDIINALNNVKIALIPCLNPDSYEVYNFGVESIKNHDLWIYKNKDSVDFENFKCNANGVDLNRNFPTQNAGLYYKSKNLISSVSLKKTTSKTAYFGGEELGSEPETRASMYFMFKHYKNAFAYINLHSQGRVLYAGKPNLSSAFNNSTLNFANKVAKITGYMAFGLASEEIGEGNDGSATDFMAELANGLKFSSETLRMSMDKYNSSSVEMKYNIPLITLETLKTYTDDPSVFKNEYYNYGLEKLFYDLIKE